MKLLEEIQKIAAGIPAALSEKKGVYKIEAVIAERKAFLSTKTLTYRATFRIDDAAKRLTFSEMLKESGAGLSGGDGMDGGMSPGFGFKVESYNTMSGARQGTIAEQSNLFGKNYQYKFDYQKIRAAIEAKAQEAGYNFVYQVMGV